MVKITDGVNVFEVTKGAFTGIYSYQGYHVVEENPTSDINGSSLGEEGDEDEMADANFEEELLEKPISSWSQKEVKRFAEIKGIDIANTKGPAEAKDLIKEFLDKE